MIIHGTIIIILTISSDASCNLVRVNIDLDDSTRGNMIIIAQCNIIWINIDSVRTQEASEGIFNMIIIVTCTIV
jgi:hypothetical protein